MVQHGGVLDQLLADLRHSTEFFPVRQLHHQSERRL
jgi:hypothetical protein